MLRSVLRRRGISTVPVNRKEAWLFVDSVFPIQLAAWDLRHYIGFFRREYLLSRLQSQLEKVKTHSFQVIDLQPHPKDGGVYVRFAYSPQVDEQDAILKDIEKTVRDEANAHGGFPNWVGLTSGNAWLVKGTPWREDMNRYASPIVRVLFDGPDVNEQELYESFRPYGRIRDIVLPGVVPAGQPRFATITFHSLPAATIARNVLYGVALRSQPSNITRIRTLYQKPIQAHAIRDWTANHPKVVLPLLIFLLGSLSYAIFDPVRAIMVEGKVLNWFDYREYSLYRWLMANTLARLQTVSPANLNPTPAVWKERSDAQDSLKAYLADKPTTIAFLHGPQGSGKTRMVESILAEESRSVLYIDCRELQKQSSDSQLIGALANQTGYWPVFTLFSSMGNLIDLASVGLIGQKAGISKSTKDQLTEILEVVAAGLARVSSSHRNDTKHALDRERTLKEREKQARITSDKIERGVWHDGRLDCVAGNGVISELGIGDEDMDPTGETITQQAAPDSSVDKRKEKSKAELDAVKALPIVIIRNYSSKVGSTREDLLETLANWAASLVENQIAHVVVLSDNRENAKRLAKALPTKPLYAIGLSDADPASSLSFMKQKLQDAGIHLEFTKEQTAAVARLGGRASDLESLIHKIRNGQDVQDAVEEIVNQNVSELRKNAFGDDMDDAKSLPWSREQVWHIINLLSKKPEIAYYDIIADFPFKGDETALRNMEHAELISITTKDGRPSTIRPGKPVFRWVFDKLVQDPVFHAAQEINYNDKAIAKNESTVKACEEELRLLGEIMASEPKPWYGWIVSRRSAARERARYVAEKMLKAEKKVQALDRRNDALKKALANAF
ncbi:hypothetical protein D9611_004476 [Ephemerocybe angulata]|uniref:Mitochondrial escape protein 2 n=1 Tax=Ephemerocybe angulata TaxID=980116 RepID=A0A8H5F5H4_9AGAR|nr:hypothetical protein D9611_004476 [Tulosesus angulatus]